MRRWRTAAGITVGSLFRIQERLRFGQLGSTAIGVRTHLNQFREVSARFGGVMGCLSGFGRAIQSVKSNHRLGPGETVELEPVRRG
jgi:hypothetical protein